MPKGLQKPYRLRMNGQITHEQFFEASSGFMWAERASIVKMLPPPIQTDPARQDWWERKKRDADAENAANVLMIWEQRIFWGKRGDKEKWANWGNLLLQIFGAEGTELVNEWELRHSDPKKNCIHNCARCEWNR